MLTIQEVFDACAALDKQRHFAQLIIVPFRFDLTNEFADDAQDVQRSDVFTLDATGYLTYTSPTIIRINHSGGGVLVLGRPIVVNPGKLVASAKAQYTVSGRGSGAGPFPIDAEIAIYAPLSIGAPPSSKIDIVSRISAGHTFSAEVEADPNAPLPVKVVGFAFPNPGTTIQAKNTLNLLLGPPSLFLTLPSGPVQGLHVHP